MPRLKGAAFNASVVRIPKGSPGAGRFVKVGGKVDLSPVSRPRLKPRSFPTIEPASGVHRPARDELPDFKTPKAKRQPAERDPVAEYNAKVRDERAILGGAVFPGRPRQSEKLDAKLDAAFGPAEARRVSLNDPDVVQRLRYANPDVADMSTDRRLSQSGPQGLIDVGQVADRFRNYNRSSTADAVRQATELSDTTGRPSTTARVEAAKADSRTGLTSADFKQRSRGQIQIEQDEQRREQERPWTKRQVAAVSAYSGGDYKFMNGVLRGTRQRVLPAGTEANIAHIRSAMLPLREHTVVSRRTGWDQLPEGFRDVESAQRLVGMTLQDKGFTSTSVGRADSVMDNGAAVGLVIEAPAGTRALFVREHSAMPGEDELLLADGTEFEVISVDRVAHQFSAGVLIRVRVKA